MGSTAQLRRPGRVFGPFILQEAFIDFARLAAEFSRKAFLLAGAVVGQDSATSSQASFITKGIFSKWNIEILTLLYTQRAMRFQEIRKSLGTISTGILSKKLNALQERELVERSVLNSKPPRVRYALTEKGLTVAKLSEPIFLYLRFHEGLLSRQTTS